MQPLRVTVGAARGLTLPQSLCDEMGWEEGSEINVDPLPGNTGIKLWSDTEPHKVAIFRKVAAA